MVTFATEEVKKVVNEYLQNNENPSIADFVEKHTNFIIQNTPSGSLIDKCWPTIIQKEALKSNKILTKSRVSWKKILDFTPANNNTTTPNSNENNNITFTYSRNNSNDVTSSKSSSASSSLGKHSRSSSAKTDSYELTSNMKEEYKRTFEALDDNKKWSLDDGTKVEDVMYAFGANCTYEHPVHSFILDIEDTCWKSVFTPSQLQQIKSVNNKPLCEYDESCKNMFSTFSQIIKNAKNRKLVLSSSSPSTTTSRCTTTAENEQEQELTNSSTYLELTVKDEEELIDELWERLAEFGLINPRKFYNLHWLQRTMDHILDLYRFKVLEWVQKNGSEMDFISRVWTILDQVFDDIMVETRRDSGSVATTVIDNEDRAVTGMAAIATKVPSIRPDLVLFKNGLEYGVAECGKGGDEEIGKKEIVETNLHCPKVMKSMFLHTASKCDNNEDVTRRLQIIGFSHFDLRMRVLVMDNPDGYVCRIRSTSQYKISTIPSNMLSGLLPILKLTLRSKLTVQSSIKLVRDYLTSTEDNEPDLQDAMDENKTRLVLPGLQKSPNKKPKK